MAPKRKLDSNSTDAQQSNKQQHIAKEEQEQHYDQQEFEEVEVEEEGDDYEEVEEEEEEEEDDEEQEDEEEPFRNLLEPFSKEQLIKLLSDAADKHADVASGVRAVADEDPAHRKIFVHGLGWDTTAETLKDAFKQYGEIEDCKAVSDKVSGKSKGYGFILFKTRRGTRNALKAPQKKIGNRMTSCQLASLGPVPSSSAAGAPAAAVAAAAPVAPVSEYTLRKIYVSNVGADLDPQKLLAFFSKYGEIEDGPLGLDKQTGKPKGFCLFVYKTIDSAKKALEEPHKNFEGHVLHCRKAVDGPKQKKQQSHHHGAGTGFVGPAGGRPGHLMAPAAPAPTMQLNQGGAAVLGQALTALLASQGAGLGLSNLLGLGGATGVGSAVNPAVPGGGHGVQGGYGNQGMGTGASSGGIPGYGSQVGYPNQQSGQGGYGWSQYGSGPYNGQ